MIEQQFRDFIRGILKALKAQTINIGKYQALRPDSKLINSFDVRVRPDFQAIQFLAFDYLQWVELGRRAGVRKVPIRALIDWIVRYNISSPNMTTNQLAYAIQTNIYKYGIEPRPMLDMMAETMTEILVDRAGKELEKSIADEFIKAFK